MVSEKINASLATIKYLFVGGEFDMFAQTEATSGRLHVLWPVA